MENQEKKQYVKWIAVSVLLALAAAGLVFGVRKLSGRPPEQFDAFLNDCFMEEVTENTINLHYILAYPENFGITGYEVTLGDFSPDDDALYEELEKLKKEITSFDKAKLTRQQQIVYDIMLDYVETELSAREFSLYEEILSPTTGFQAQLPVVLAEYTFRTRRDIEDYLELISQIDDAFEEIVDFERKKAKAGLFMSDDVADAIIEQCAEFIREPEENYMIEVFDDKIASFEGLSGQEKEEYRKRNHDIITTEVTEGYQTLIDGLTELKGSGINELGLFYYENGKEYYEYLVRTATGSDLSVKKLQKSTEKFLENFLFELQMKIIENPSLYYELTEYEYPVTEPEEITEDLKSKTGEYFPEPPKVNYRIKRVHPSMEEHLSPAFYLTTPVDDLENNVIYINGKYVDNGQNELYPTLAHEGYPGHLYQNVYTGSSELPLIRNLFSYPGYSEGWATYVEFEYSGLLAGMEEDIAKLTGGESAWALAMSAYIDMAVHYDGWTKEDVSEFLMGYGIGDAGTVDEIFDLIVQEPANYLSYFIGYLEILNLREAAQKELGDDFHVKEFHEFLLQTGPAPFYIIEDYMEEWMEERAAS
ncbi:MAG: DUF885 domain-containing protein [Lachnospiraceae bacterium]|nr:DUF885 domain-containing protein [Lachnospiraceae bacterium]